MFDQTMVQAIELFADRLADKIVYKQSLPEQHISTEDLIRLKRVTPQTISRWIKAGMPYEKGKPNRFKLSKVEQWLERR